MRIYIVTIGGYEYQKNISACQDFGSAFQDAQSYINRSPYKDKFTPTNLNYEEEEIRKDDLGFSYSYKWEGPHGEYVNIEAWETEGR